MRMKVLTITLVLLMALLPLAMQSGVAPPGLPSIRVDVEDVEDVETDPVDYLHVSHTAEVTVANFPLGATVKVNAPTLLGVPVSSPCPERFRPSGRLPSITSNPGSPEATNRYSTGTPTVAVVGGVAALNMGAPGAVIVIVTTARREL